MNLLIFLVLTYNPCKNFKFYSLQGQNLKIFLIFTYNQGKVFLILPVTREGRGHMYTWSSLGVTPHPSRSQRTLSLTLSVKSLNIQKWHVYYHRCQRRKLQQRNFFYKEKD